MKIEVDVYAHLYLDVNDEDTLDGVHTILDKLQGLKLHALTTDVGPVQLKVNGWDDFREAVWGDATK